MNSVVLDDIMADAVGAGRFVRVAEPGDGAGNDRLHIQCSGKLTKG